LNKLRNNPYIGLNADIIRINKLLRDLALKETSDFRRRDYNLAAVKLERVKFLIKTKVDQELMNLLPVEVRDANETTDD
jgi:hypothetical protein